MRRLSRRCLPLAFLLLILLLGTEPAAHEAMLGRGSLASPAVKVQAKQTAQAKPPRPPTELEKAASVIVVGTNAFRQNQKLTGVKEDASLTRAAAYFARYLAKVEKLSHTADGREPWDRAKMYFYDYCIVLENIAVYFSSASVSPEELAAHFMKGWEDSPGHRKNMQDSDVMEIGVAVARSPRSGKYYAVQMFGRPRSAEVQFRISNQTPAAVKYRLDDQTTSIAPQITTTHRQCRTPEMEIPAGSKNIVRPTPGSHYLIRKDKSQKLKIDKE